jgi:hypothetical protein
MGATNFVCRDILTGPEDADCRLIHHACMRDVTGLAVYILEGAGM